ncbi:MAG: SIR2 family protein [Candidatus Solibacter usitatus]|nr:SIR2 family protein [Candidatus Solibacter usitatus]
MEKAFISRANFRLAHLLLDKTITNLVVTTNFDDFLSRALTLFGQNHVVCDHPRTLERIDLRSQDVQVIHVHGSYWFYDCCNLRPEILERAKGSSSTSFTMLSMLDDILRAHSPLVIGYSGWEGDVFMTALRRRLATGLRTNLYWFCYRRPDAQSLPEWLSSCPNVCVVVPDETKLPKQAPPELTRGEGPIGVLEMNALSSSMAGSEDPALEATAVFDELIRRFNLEVPRLTKDPAAFFSNYLKMSLLGDKPDELESDVYAIRGVVDRLERLSQLEEQLARPSQAESLLESFRNAVRQSDNRTAIRLASQIPLEGLTVEQLREVSAVLVNAGPALNDNSDEELRSYDLTVTIANRLDAFSPSEPSTKTQVSIALVNKAITLGTLNRNEDAIAVCEEVTRRFGDATELALRQQVATALSIKAFRLGALNRGQEEIAAYDEVTRRFGDATDLVLRERIARALFNKALTLGTLKRSQEEIAAFDEVTRRFGDATELALREPVAKALVNKAFRLGTLDRNEEAIAVYDEVARRFGDATELPLCQQVAMALLNKSFRLGKLNRNEEAIAVCDEVTRRFGDATQLALRERVAKALVNKAHRLDILNRSEEEIVVYDEVTRRFGDASELALREQVARALVNKAITLGTLNRNEEAIAVYDEITRRFGDATEPALREWVQKAQAGKEQR